MWYIVHIFNHLKNRNPKNVSYAYVTVTNFRLFKLYIVYLQSEARKSTGPTGSDSNKQPTETNIDKPTSTTEPPVKTTIDNTLQAIYEEIFGMEAEERRKKTCRTKIAEAYSFCVGTTAELYISRILRFLEIGPTLQALQKSMHNKYMDFKNSMYNFTMKYIKF